MVEVHEVGRCLAPRIGQVQRGLDGLERGLEFRLVGAVHAVEGDGVGHVERPRPDPAQRGNMAKTAQSAAEIAGDAADIAALAADHVQVGRVRARGLIEEIDLEQTRENSDSVLRYLHARVAPLGTAFILVLCDDQTESKRVDAVRRDFVANVSHELKTPVGGIALLAEALLQDPGDQETVEYFGNKVYKEANRMADMVSELISLSKLQGAEALPEMEPLAVDDLIEEALSRNQLAAEARSIELNRGASVGVQVKGDRSLLVTALSNLVSNAINYSPEKMPVSVSQKVVDGGVVLIRVTDRGIGIAPDDQKRVFERFFRVDQARSRQTGGTGLGLAIVKHVVANHGGNIKLWSRPGTGSTFTIELPIYREEKPAQDAGMKDNEKRDAVTAAAPGLPRAVARVAARRKDKAQ